MRVHVIGYNRFIYRGCQNPTSNLIKDNPMHKFKLLVATLGLVFAASASAQTYTFNFGDKLTGKGPASSNIATLIFNDVNKMFTLTLANSFASTFGRRAYVGAFGVDYSANDPKVTGVVSGGGVKTVRISSADGPASTDFRYTFGRGNDRLMSAETVSWFSADSIIIKKRKVTTVAGFDVKNFKGGLLRVQGITGLKGREERIGSSSTWYSIAAVSPVPEAQTSSMMLLGLGLMGFIARRRSNNQA